MPLWWIDVILWIFTSMCIITQQKKGALAILGLSTISQCLIIFAHLHVRLLVEVGTHSLLSGDLRSKDARIYQGKDHALLQWSFLSFLSPFTHSIVFLFGRRKTGFVDNIKCKWLKIMVIKTSN